MTEQTTLGGGCFWCTEAVFQQLAGVESVVSGYSAGATEAPTYEQICTGATGHAEVIQITFDPNLISFADLLAVFFATHDPTTLNQQGADRGTQYRSIILCQSPEQRTTAERIVRELDASDAFPRPIVTAIEDLEVFYPAEDYHQDFYNANPNQPYCQAVIPPKIEKLRKLFSDRLQS